MKKILLFACPILALCLGSCSSSDSRDMRIELARPAELKVTTELATATFTWDAVDKTAGYAYALDGSSDYTRIDASLTSITLTKLSRGAHTFTLYSVGDEAHTMDSAERSIDFTIDPTLPAPIPSFSIGDEEDIAVVKWAAIKGAFGYEYKFDETAEWTAVGEDVLKITEGGFDPEAEHPFSIRAIGQLPDSETSPVYSTTFQLIDTSEGIWVKRSSGGIFGLRETAEGSKVFTATIEFNATDEFEVLVEGETYGFTTYSGNGGVGTVAHANATMYFSSTDHYVNESVGQMSVKSEGTGINKFWTNLPARSKVFVKVDCNFTRPRYYLQLVREEDASVLLEQRFDLMTLGGNWLTGKNGLIAEETKATSMDGTEPGKESKAASTLGVTIQSIDSANPEYIRNRGLSGWGVENCFEFAGNIRISSPGNGILTTPKLIDLTETSTITLTFDALQFGATTNNIPVKVLGSGTIKSAEVKIQGASPATAITPESDNTSIIMTNVHCPSYANGVQKQYSTFTVVIENASSDTQISWDTTGLTVSNARMILDNIVIKKN